MFTVFAAASPPTQAMSPGALPLQADLRGYDHFVVTPHAGEYKRMGGDYDYDHPMDLMRAARDWAQKMNLNLVLNYWGNTNRTYHHTAPTNSLFALHEALCTLPMKRLVEPAARAARRASSGSSTPPTAPRRRSTAATAEASRTRNLTKA